jgi:hypothetical protein
LREDKLNSLIDFAREPRVQITIVAAGIDIIRTNLLGTTVRNHPNLILVKKILKTIPKGI